MATAETLIKAALRKLGNIYPSGGSPTSHETADGFEALNSMLGMWSAKKIMVPYSIRENFNLVGGTTGYTMGTAGTASATRAKKILGAFIRDTNSIDYPIEVIAEEQYNSISQKSTRSRPTSLFYKPTYPVGTIYFYPTPDEQEAVYIDSLKQLTTLTSHTETISLPSEYEEAIIYNLAIRLAPEFGKNVSGEVASLARETYNTVMALNSSSYIELMSAPAGMPCLSQSYNINEG